MFGFHPVNLAFRFVLEIGALVLLGWGGYELGTGFLCWVLAIGLPLLGLTVWATFNVPGDESRSGNAPVPVPGFIRLIVEFDFFAGAVIIGWFASPSLAIGLAIAVMVHYALSIDRIRWLLSQR